MHSISTDHNSTIYTRIMSASSCFTLKMKLLHLSNSPAKTVPYHGNNSQNTKIYDGVSKSSRTGLLERELRIVQLSDTRYSCIAILWVSLMSFVAIILYVTSQWVSIIIVVVHFVIDSVRELLVTPSYLHTPNTFPRRGDQLSTGTTIPLRFLSVPSLLTAV